MHIGLADLMEIRSRFMPVSIVDVVPPFGQDS